VSSVFTSVTSRIPAPVPVRIGMYMQSVLLNTFDMTCQKYSTSHCVSCQKVRVASRAIAERQAHVCSIFICVFIGVTSFIPAQVIAVT